jgi:hypothetical protein
VCDRLAFDESAAWRRDLSRIPADDARLRVIGADGAGYMMRGEIRTDVILLDAFAAEGMSRCCADIAFFTACRERAPAFACVGEFERAGTRKGAHTGRSMPDRSRAQFALRSTRLPSGLWVL